MRTERNPIFDNCITTLAIVNKIDSEPEFLQAIRGFIPDLSKEGTCSPLQRKFCYVLASDYENYLKRQQKLKGETKSFHVGEGDLYIKKLSERPSVSDVLPLITKYNFKKRKLECLLYLQQAFHLAYFGTPLFSESYEMCADGPHIMESKESSSVVLTELEIKLFDVVLEKFSQLDEYEIIEASRKFYNDYDKSQYQIYDDSSMNILPNFHDLLVEQIGGIEKVKYLG